MSTTTTFENLNQYGTFTIVTITKDDNDVSIGNHRKTIELGYWSDANTFVMTDMSGEDQATQAFATNAWTADVITAFKAKFPFRPLNAEQVRLAAYKADSTRQNLIALINASTPAQINTWLTNNVTTLVQARAVLAQIIILLGGNSII